MKRLAIYQLIGLMSLICAPLQADNLEGLDIAPDVEESIGKNNLKPLEPPEGYFSPEAVTRHPPKYPEGRVKKRQEGLAEIVFMVNTDGTTSNMAAIDSTHPDFEVSSLEAVQRYKYNPAQFNGKAVQAASEIRVVYMFEGGTQKAGPTFYRTHKRVNKELDKGAPNQESIRKGLDKMLEADYLSMYTLAYLYLTEYRYATKFLGKHEQLYILQKLLLFDDQMDEKRRFLEAGAIKSIKMNILQLLIQLGYYGEARQGYYELQKDLPDAAEPFAKPMSQVQKILESGEALSRSVKIRERGSEYLRLTKDNVEILDVKGKIEKLNFYCSLGFGSLDFKPESNYKIPESWGSCNLLIVGEPGTTATMYQH